MESIEKLFPLDLQDKILLILVVIAVYFSNFVARSNFSFPLRPTLSARELSFPGQVIYITTEYIRSTYDLQCIIGGVRNYIFVTYFISEARRG